MNVNDRLELYIQSRADYTTSQKIKLHLTKSHAEVHRCKACRADYSTKEVLAEHQDLTLDDSVRTVKACKVLRILCVFEPVGQLISVCLSVSRSVSVLYLIGILTNLTHVLPSSIRAFLNLLRKARCVVSAGSQFRS